MPDLTRISGSVVLPDGSVPYDGRIHFTPAGWDSPAVGGVQPPATRSFTLGPSGGLVDVYLSPSTTSMREMPYRVSVTHFNVATRAMETTDLGLISVPEVAEGESVSIRALLSDPGVLPAAPDALAQITAKSLEVSSDRAAAQSARTAAEAAAAVAQSGTDVSVEAFAELSSRLRYSGATGSQINVTAGMHIRDRSTGAIYRVLSSSALGADLDYTASGGVRLRFVGPVVYAAAFGGHWDGVGDDTAAINRAIASLAGGGVVYLPRDGITRCNVQINVSGVIIDGQQLVGSQPSTSYPTSGMIIAHNPALPAVIIGSDTDGVEGSGLRSIPVLGRWDYAGGIMHAQRGVHFAGGSKRCVFEHSFVRDFADANISWSNAAGVTSSENRIHAVQSAVGATTNIGARAMYGVDLDGGETSFSNDHFLSDVYLRASANHIALELDGSTVWAASLKIDCADGGVIFKKTSSALPPRIYGATEVDGQTTACNVLHFFRDLRSSSAQIEKPFSGRGSVDGLILYSEVQTTGTVTSGSATMTVASAAGFFSGRQVLIYSTAGIVSRRIVSVSGATVTLSAAVGFSATGATVYVGDAESGLGAIHGVGSVYNLYDNTQTGPVEKARRPLLTGRNAQGGVFPYNGFNLVWDFNFGEGITFAQVSAEDVTASSLSRTSGTATLTGSMGGAPSGASTGWFVTISGAREDGFNGCWPLTTVSGNFTATFPCPGVDATATGTIKFSIWKCVQISKGDITLPQNTGVKHRTSSGIMTPVLPSGSNTLGYVPNGDTADGKTGLGFWIMQFGSAILGTANTAFRVAMQTSPFTTVMNINGSGGLAIGQGQSASMNAPGVQIAQSSGEKTQDAGTSGFLYNLLGRATWRNSTVTYPLGHKVPAPASATSAGRPGDWAADASYLYVYTGDGASHAWRRSSLSSW